MPIQTLVLVSVACAFGLGAIAMLGVTYFTMEQCTTVIVRECRVLRVVEQDRDPDGGEEHRRARTCCMETVATVTT